MAAVSLAIVGLSDRYYPSVTVIVRPLLHVECTRTDFGISQPLRLRVKWTGSQLRCVRSRSRLPL
jgi:hypothetical protein